MYVVMHQIHLATFEYRCIDMLIRASHNLQYGRIPASCEENIKTQKFLGCE